MNEDRRAVLFGQPDLLGRLREIPAVILDPEERRLPSSAVSLKQCFSRDQLDDRHVDSLILKKIARSMARLMKDLADRSICPGLYDMKDIYVDMSGEDYPVFLTRPERFQMGDMEQDYEWFPEDERLLPDRVLFDQKDQDKANQRFLFRILVGSSRGNIHFPPVRSDMDYAQIFYNILPEDWKRWMEEERVVSSREWIETLSASIAAEEAFVRQIHDKEGNISEAGPDPVEDGLNDRDDGFTAAVTGPGRTRHVLYLLLRTDLDCADTMSHLLYDMQDFMEADAGMRRDQLNTAIVYGSGSVKARDFRCYPDRFRFQIPPYIEEYSAGEAMLVSAALIDQIANREQGDSLQMVILLDGRLPNDRIFKAGLTALTRLQKEGVSFLVRSAGDVDCEACSSLKDLENNGEQL